MATVSVTLGHNNPTGFISGETVTPAKLNSLGTPTVAISNIVNADISASADIADTKLATISTAGKVSNSATTATNANTASAIVARDASGNFTAGTITAALTGNASTATTLQTARTINGVSFNGSANITVTAAPDFHTHGNITNAGAIGSTANLPVVTTTSGVLTTIAAGTAGQVLTSNGGGSAPSFQTLAATSTNANNLTGGSAGTVPYQSAAGTTAMLAAGTNGQVLRSNGAAAPSWLSLAASATTDTTSATNITTGTLANARTTATNANTASTIVARDASGNFSAGTITATLTGNVTGNLTGTASAVADGAVTTAKIADSNVTLAKLAAAVANALVPVGSVYAFARNTAPTGWLAANGGTFGSASSGATSAAADYEALFTLLWANGWTDANLPILTSAGGASTRGASATADWTANKRLTLPDLSGIFVRGSGSQTISGITYNKTFAAKEGDAFQSHIHPVTAMMGAVTWGAGSGNNIYLGTTGFTSGPTDDGTNGTPRTASETRPANIALLYCIKF